jgi:hypothetical protein
MAPASRQICRVTSAPGHAGSIPERSPKRRSAASAPPAHKRHPAARIVQLRFLGEQNIRCENERFRPELRAEIYNLFNHFNPDPQTVDRNIRSQTFGMIGGACAASPPESSNWEQISTSKQSPFGRLDAFASYRQDGLVCLAARMAALRRESG